MKEKWVVNGFEQEKWINEKFRENIFKSLEAVVRSCPTDHLFSWDLQCNKI